jgi:hypothetical protein
MYTITNKLPKVLTFDSGVNCAKERFVTLTWNNVKKLARHLSGAYPNGRKGRLLTLLSLIRPALITSQCTATAPSKAPHSARVTFFVPML